MPAALYGAVDMMTVYVHQDKHVWLWDVCTGVRLTPGAYTATAAPVLGSGYIQVTCPPSTSRGASPPFALNMAGSTFTMDVRRNSQLMIVDHYHVTLATLRLNDT